MIENAILIAGPTASGKSALALELAQRVGGVIVNADSMQVYSVLRVLTARPEAEDLSVAPHFLYGHVDPRRVYSTGEWLREVEALAGNGAFSEKRVLFVGGTGLYFRALMGGLAAMPDIPDATREHWRERLAEEGAERLHRLLHERDAEAAGRIAVSDGQRIVRALEVLDVSGRSILSWQAEKAAPLVDPHSAFKVLVEPDRAWLRTRIDARFDGMMAAGALEEVEALIGLGVDPAAPAMKAIGVRELQEVLAGQARLEEAVERAKAASRAYCKRQMTWFRHQLTPDWERIVPTGLSVGDRIWNQVANTRLNQLSIVKINPS